MFSPTYTFSSEPDLDSIRVCWARPDQTRLSALDPSSSLADTYATENVLYSSIVLLCEDSFDTAQMVRDRERMTHSLLLSQAGICHLGQDWHLRPNPDKNLMFLNERSFLALSNAILSYQHAKWRKIATAS